MTRAYCYKLLGLAPGATEAEIRRQYKRMALRLHPDINPDPKANEQFIQLTTAVEILLSPEPTPQERVSSRKPATAETEAERKARMDEARKRYERQKAYKYHENNRYYAQLTTGKRWQFFKWIMRVSTLLSCALVLDVILPHHVETDTMLAYSSFDHNGILYERITSVELDDGGMFFVENDRGTWMSTYPEVLVEKTWLLHTPVKLYNSDDFDYYETGFDFHIGAVRWPVALLLLIPLLTYFRQRKDLLFVFLYQLSFWAVGLLAIFLLMTQERLVHLLSLGFV